MDVNPHERPQNSFRVVQSTASSDSLSDLSCCLRLCVLVALLMGLGGTSIVHTQLSTLNAAEWVALASLGVIGLAAIALIARIITRAATTRYRLRTLVILTAVGPPALAALWFAPTYLPSVAMIVAFLLLGAIIVAAVVAAALAVPLLLGWVFSLVANALVHLLVNPENRR